MATPTAEAQAGDNEHHEEHLSPYPLILGVGVLFMYIGFAYLKAESLVLRGILPVGTLIFLYALAGWVREDVKMWDEGFEMPGVSPGKSLGWWGMLFFLATEVMLFGGLFATYFVLRAENPEAWIESQEFIQHALGLVAVNTLILMSSGATLHWGIHNIQKGNRKGLIQGLVLTIILGLIFLGVQVQEYLNLIHEGVTLSSGPFGSVFYILTGTHGFHVFLGLTFLAVVLYRALKGQFTAERHVAADAFAIYWHFVDVVWVLLFLVVYVGTAYFPPGVA